MTNAAYEIGADRDRAWIARMLLRELTEGDPDWELLIALQEAA